MDHKHNENHTLSQILSEESRARSPSFHHLTHQNSVPHVHTTNFSSELTSTLQRDTPEASPMVLPLSPESKWSFSPPPTPTQPLLYRCVSSIRHQGNIYSLAASGRLVFTGSSSSHIRAWQPLDCCEKGYIQASCGKIHTMLSHGDMLFTSHKDNKVRIWSVIGCSANFNPKKITTLPKSNRFKKFLSRSNVRQHKDTVSCMAYNHDEGVLYTGSWDKTVKYWTLSDAKCKDSFVAHANNINDMVINQDGFLFTCSSDGTIKMWSRVCGETFHTLTMTLSFLSYPIYALALSLGSTTQRSILYSGSSDGCINFWVQQISGCYSHGGLIQAHQFAVLRIVTLENLVISGSEDATIKIWRRGIEGKMYHECVAILEGHKGPVKCLAACLEKDNIMMGFLVFSASSDRTFKVWRVKVLPEMKRNNLDCGNGDDIISSEVKRNSLDRSTRNELILSDEIKRKSLDRCNLDDIISPELNRKSFDCSGLDIVDKRFEEFDINPALSPTWVVEKKRQSRS